MREISSDSLASIAFFLYASHWSQAVNDLAQQYGSLLMWASKMDCLEPRRESQLECLGNRKIVTSVIPPAINGYCLTASAKRAIEDRPITFPP